ncbi:MAG: hypothetical protein ACR2J5_17380 [Geodermatophilaceae bacterium]
MAGITDLIIGMATDDALVFPIGHCIDAYYDLPASNDHFFQVRVGPDVIRLDDDQFAIWGLAHGSRTVPRTNPGPGRPC